MGAVELAAMKILLLQEK